MEQPLGEAVAPDDLARRLLAGRGELEAVGLGRTSPWPVSSATRSGPSVTLVTSWIAASCSLPRSLALQRPSSASSRECVCGWL